MVLQSFRGLMHRLHGDNQLIQVRGDQSHRNGQEDDSEELAQDEDSSNTHQLFNEIQVAQHEINENNVQKEPGQYIYRVEFGTHREQCCECPRTGYQRKYNRHQRCRRILVAVAFGFENFHPENHLDGNDQDHDCTCNGERREVHLEEFQDSLAHEQEYNQDGE